MESGGVYLFRNMGSFETIFVDDTNQVSLQSAQPTRNLPNILRGSNARTCKNYKTFMLDKDDVSLVSLAEDANASFHLNATLSNDSERDDKYGKVSSPRSHHQRKQVHHPLEVLYDVQSWNNNNNANKEGKGALQTIDELETLYVSLDHKEDTRTKKISDERNDEERRCVFKKSTLAATGKSGDKRTAKSSDFDTDSAVAARSNNFFDDDASIDIVEVATKSDEWLDIFYRNNDVYKLEKKGDTSCNSLVSGGSAECDAMQQYAASQKDPLSYEFAVGENDSEENSMSKSNRSNFLLTSEMLCTCTCAKCTICERDIVLYEDHVPSYVNSNLETELFRPHAYDFYTSDYYHVLGDMDGFDEIFSYEVAENTSVSRESACNDNVGECTAAKLNVSTPAKQCESENSQTLGADIAQDICVQSSPMELVTLSDESPEPPKVEEHARDLDEAGYSDAEMIITEKIPIKTNETIFQKQDTASINVPAPVPPNNRRRKKSKKGNFLEECCNELSISVSTVFELLPFIIDICDE